MASQLDSECLLATIGVHNVIEGKATLHKYQLIEAANMPKEIRRLMLRFMATDGFEAAEDYADIDYPALKKLLAHGQTPEQAASLHAAVPDPELAQDMAAEVNRIQQWANTVLPRETRMTIRGPIDEDPSPSELSNFARLWQVACDPMTIMRDLLEGNLFDDQVAALGICWPALHGEMKQAVAEGVSTISGRSKTWEPTMLKASLLATLRQESDFDADLASAIQASYAQEAQQEAQPPAPPKPSGTEEDIDKTLTPGERAAGGG